jgi:hypothetical protein
MRVPHVTTIAHGPLPRPVRFQLKVKYKGLGREIRPFPPCLGPESNPKDIGMAQDGHRNVRISHGPAQIFHSFAGQQRTIILQEFNSKPSSSDGR